MVGPTLMTDADNGTIGSYPPGQTTNSTAPSAPYPGITPGFTYPVDPDKPDGETGTGRATLSPPWCCTTTMSKPSLTSLDR